MKNNNKKWTIWNSVTNAIIIRHSGDDLIVLRKNILATLFLCSNGKNLFKFLRVLFPHSWFWYYYYLIRSLFYLVRLSCVTLNQIYLKCQKVCCNSGITHINSIWLEEVYLRQKSWWWKKKCVLKERGSNKPIFVCICRIFFIKWFKKSIMWIRKILQANELNCKTSVYVNR